MSALDSDILQLIPEANIEADIVQADEVRERMKLYPGWNSPSSLESLSLSTHVLPILPLEISMAHLLRTLLLTRLLGGPTANPPARDPAADPPTHASGRPTTHGAKIKLPKISLPQFRGDPVKWTSFWDAYNSTIHSNAELSEVDKFNYLQSLLDHTALDAVAGLMLNSANYLQAVEILHKRFGNKQVIISKHMETLMNMDTAVTSPVRPY